MYLALRDVLLPFSSLELDDSQSLPTPVISEIKLSSVSDSRVLREASEFEECICFRLEKWQVMSKIMMVNGATIY